MRSTYIVYNIVPYAFILLLVFIFIDVFLDYFRKVRKSNKKRILLYSFIFYLISLIQVKFGGFTVFQNPADTSSSYISTNDWFGIFDTISHRISFWGYSAFFYNVLLLIPLGVFLSFLFNKNSKMKAMLIVIITCLGIHYSSVLFGSFGLTRGVINVDIIYTLFNILGGVFGLFFGKWAIDLFHSFKVKNEVKALKN